MPAPADAPGTDPFADPSARYSDGERLGAGGMGEVSVQRDQWLGRDVATKRLRPDRTSREAHQRFLLEARVMGRLEHPNIVPVYDAGSDADGPWFAMRRIHGESLQALLEGRALGTLLRRLDIFLKVCDALRYAHARGVIHRDVKPGNVMVGAHGEVLLLDWGCARILGSPELPPDPTAISPDTGLTHGDAVLGTPGYMAPEQALGQTDAISERTDVYALGALLYALLTGTPPYPRGAKNGVDVLERVKAGDLDPPRTRDPSVPWELEALVLKAMALRPEDRFADVEALRQAVVAYQEGRELAFVRYGHRHRLWRFVRRHGRAVAAVGAVVSLSAIAVSLAASLYSLGLRASLDRVTAAEREAASRLAREQVALALLEGSDGRFDAARAKLDAARVGLARLGASLSPVDAADAWLADLAPPPALLLRPFDRVALSDDGSRLVVGAGGSAGAASVVALPTGRVIDAIEPPDGLDAAMVGVWLWRGEPVAAWSSGGALRLRGRDGDIARFPASPGLVALAGDRWFSDEGGTTTIRAVPSGEPVAAVDGALIRVNASGSRLVTATRSASSASFGPPEDARVWDAETGAELWRGPFTFALDVSPRGDALVAVTGDVIARIDLATGATVARGPASAGDRPAFSPDGRTLAVMNERRLRFLDPASLGVRGEQLTPGAILRSSGGFRVADGGGRVATDAADQIEVWSPPDGPSWRSVGVGGELRAVAASPDGGWIGAAGGDGVLYLIERRSGAVMASWPTSPDGTRDVAFSPDGAAVFTGDRDGDVRRFGLGDATGRSVGSGCAIVAAVAPLDADSVVATCAAGRVVGLRFDPDTGDGSVVWSVDPGLGALWDGRLAPDRGAVLLVNRDGAHPMAAWLSLDTHAVTILGEEQRVSYRAATTADGRVVAVGDHQGQVRVFGADGGAAPWVFDVSDEVVVSVALSPDGALLAAGDYSGAVHLWDVARRAPLGVFELHGDDISDLEWVPGTRALVSVGGDGVVRQLDLDAGARASSSWAARALAEPPPVAELARLAEARGSWADALASYEAAAADGGVVAHLDEARASLVLGRLDDAERGVRAAADAGELSAAASGVWLRAIAARR